MKNFKFYQKCVADKYWLPRDSKVEVVEYEASLGCFHVCFIDVFNRVVHDFLYLDDIKSICECVHNSFGEESHSFICWLDIYHTLKSLNDEKL